MAPSRTREAAEPVRALGVVVPTVLTVVVGTGSMLALVLSGSVAVHGVAGGQRSDGGADGALPRVRVPAAVSAQRTPGPGRTPAGRAPRTGPSDDDPVTAVPAVFVRRTRPAEGPSRGPGVSTAGMAGSEAAGSGASAPDVAAPEAGRPVTPVPSTSDPDDGRGGGVSAGADGGAVGGSPGDGGDHDGGRRR